MASQAWPRDHHQQDKSLIRNRLFRRRPHGVEVYVSVLGILASLILLFMLGRSLKGVGDEVWAGGGVWPRLEFALFALVIAGLSYGALVYMMSRLGYHLRLSRVQRNPSDPVPGHERYGAADPLAILVPSYMEDADTIRNTLLSAGLQDYPNRRVVLLLDDSPQPVDAGDFKLLRDALAIPGELNELFAEPFSAMMA